MTIHRAHPRQQGFSMLEVLIAVLVFSLGMIGLAGLLIFAIQSNHVAYLRTQATFLAHNMAARMDANPAGVWEGDYNKSVLPLGTGITTTCTAGCSPADLATHDLQLWSQQVNTFLPKASGKIDCDASALSIAPAGTQVDMRPPYGGKCTMTLSWNEARTDNGEQQTHTFQWVFQP
jgi:type IV pilus assembly protein PilV